ncbi:MULTISPECIES: hypothetical protein [Asticcacaulis]|uniref:hypothetical protein n=1 Tax=Asticcacaulis TaxID=76890 RepID=UPI001AE4CF3E|nr:MULTISPECIES: hypothetical protein [Asticcacaulis]MBP2160441.1 hypothetical protein [Asticcacaulis solisilvae]MDR6801486.1 hypothetical protein [Asticcacaulis sp. BE141]
MKAELWSDRPGFRILIGWGAGVLGDGMKPVMEEGGKAKVGLTQARWLQQHYSLGEGGWPGPIAAVAIAVFIFAATLQPLSALFFGAIAAHGLICLRRPSQPEPWAPAIAIALFPAYIGVYLVVMIAVSLWVAPNIEWLERHAREVVAVPPLFYRKALAGEPHTVFFWVMLDVSLPLAFGLWYHAARRLPYRFHAVFRLEKRYPDAAEPQTALYKVRDRQLQKARGEEQRVTGLILLLFAATACLAFGGYELVSDENRTFLGRHGDGIALFGMPGFWVWSLKFLMGVAFVPLAVSSLITEVFEPRRDRLKAMAASMRAGGR